MVRAGGPSVLGWMKSGLRKQYKTIDIKIIKKNKNKKNSPQNSGQRHRDVTHRIPKSQNEACDFPAIFALSPVVFMLSYFDSEVLCLLTVLVIQISICFKIELISLSVYILFP